MISGERKVGVRQLQVKIFAVENIFTCDKLSYFSSTFFPDKVYENLETLRSYSDKRGIKNKQNSAFLLISANKDSLYLGIQTYFL